MDNPHLMYQLDGGLWSKTPGEAFEKKEEQKGFPYKIVIDIYIYVLTASPFILQNHKRYVTRNI